MTAEPCLFVSPSLLLLNISNNGVFVFNFFCIYNRLLVLRLPEYVITASFRYLQTEKKDILKMAENAF